MDGLYVLLEDVSLQGQTWTPIGTAEEPFTGVFNGNNKTIDGLTLSNPEVNAGLFGVNSGSVKCYYLNTSSTKSVGNISTLDTTSSKTSDEIKTLADTLGDAFKNSNEGDGYPKLSWEE